MSELVVTHNCIMSRYQGFSYRSRSTNIWELITTSLHTQLLIIVCFSNSIPADINCTHKKHSDTLTHSDKAINRKQTRHLPMQVGNKKQSEVILIYKHKTISYNIYQYISVVLINTKQIYIIPVYIWCGGWDTTNTFKLDATVSTMTD